MGEDAGGRADEVGAAGVVGNEGDDEDGGVGEGDLAGHGRPAGERRTLQAEEEEDAAEEAFDAAALAQLVLGPGGREAGEVFGRFRVEGDDSDSAKGGVDPRDQGASPLGGVEAYHAGVQVIEGDSGGEQGLGTGGVVAIGRGNAEEEGQAGAAAEQGMHTVTAQEGGGMMGRSMAVLRVGIGATPRLDRGAVNDQVARPADAAAQDLLHGEDEERLARRGGGAGGALPLVGGTGHPGCPIVTRWQAAGERQGGPRLQPIRHGAGRETPQRAQQSNQQQRLVAVAPWGTPRPSGQGRGTAPPRLLHGQAAQRAQVQARHEGKRARCAGPGHVWRPRADLLGVGLAPWMDTGLGPWADLKGAGTRPRP